MQQNIQNNYLQNQRPFCFSLVKIHMSAVSPIIVCRWIHIFHLPDLDATILKSQQLVLAHLTLVYYFGVFGVLYICFLVLYKNNQKKHTSIHQSKCVAGMWLVYPTTTLRIKHSWATCICTCQHTSFFVRQYLYPYAPWCWNIYLHLPEYNHPVLQANIPASWFAYGYSISQLQYIYNYSILQLYNWDILYIQLYMVPTYFCHVVPI